MPILDVNLQEALVQIEMADAKLSAITHERNEVVSQLAASSAAYADVAGQRDVLLAEKQTTIASLIASRDALTAQRDALSAQIAALGG